MLRLFRGLPTPQGPDALELAFYRARGATELGGDLLVAVPFHLSERHRTQRVIAQAGQKALALLGHLKSKFRAGLLSDDLFDPFFPGSGAGRASQRRFAAHGAAASLLPA